MKYNYAFKYTTPDGTHYVGNCVATCAAQVLELISPNIKGAQVTFLEQLCEMPNEHSICVTKLTQVKDSSYPAVRAAGGVYCRECVFRKEIPHLPDFQCGRQDGVMEGFVAGGVGWCTAGIKEEKE